MYRLMAFLFFPLLLGTAHVQAGGAGDDLADLTSRLRPLEQLSAAFTQTVSGADGYELQSLTGTLTVARPGRVYWQSEEPYPQLVVSDATTLWLYDPDLEQVTVRPFHRDISRTPAILFIGDVEQLGSRYSVTGDQKGAVTVFWLTPLEPDSLYRKLAIEFEGSVPVGMSLWDSLEQRTHIELREVKINEPVDDSLFSFSVPPGVDVLYDD